MDAGLDRVTNGNRDRDRFASLDENPELQDLIRKIRDQEASRSQRHQDVLKDIIRRRNLEIATLTRSRDEEISSLTAEIATLQKQVAELQAENASLNYLSSTGRSSRRSRSPRPMGDIYYQSPPRIVASGEGSVDVRMVYPGLEGIHLRPQAVQRRTFSDTEPYDTTSRLSPPVKPSRGASKEQTLQVLKAPEERRLTIHAGHTPSHSISHLPNQDPAQEARAMAAAAAAAAAIVVDVAGADLPLPEPANDPALRGPLMLRNDRETDEFFLQEVKDRLEIVRQSRENSAGPSSPTSSDTTGGAQKA